MNKKWKQGSGEAIGFGICMTFMTMFLIYLIGFFILTRTTNQMENAANLIARNIVVCDSIEDARVLAQDKAEEYLTDYMSVISTDSIEATENADANEWRKRCREYNLKKKELDKAPLNTSVAVVINGEKKIFTKSVHQKRKKWINWSESTYITTDRIINLGYEIIGK